MYIYLSDVPYILVFSFCTFSFTVQYWFANLLISVVGFGWPKKCNNILTATKTNVSYNPCVCFWEDEWRSNRVSEYQSIMLTYHDWNDDNDNVNIDINYNTICNSLLSISDKNHSFIIFFPKPSRKSPKITKTDCKKFDILSRIST